MNILLKLKKLFHVHAFEEVKKTTAIFNVTIFLRPAGKERCLKILEKCSCGEYRAYIVDSAGTVYDRVPELLFPEEFFYE